MLVSICVCTYQRDHLKHTLDSIYELALPANSKIEVIVVDNDPDMYARSIINAAGFLKKIRYLHEPIRNISAARNKCLENAKGDWVAFIDDDEVADKYWLISLLETAQIHSAAIVFGNVIAEYPTNVPDWIIKGGYFQRVSRKTGTEVSSGGCGCCLINRECLGDGYFKFSLEFGLTGGEDAELFYRIHQNGHKLVFCNEAYVTELVEEKRLSRVYLKDRAFRVGQTFSRYRYGKDISVKNKLGFVIKSILKLILNSIPIVPLYLINDERWFKYFLRCCDSYGKISYFLNKSNKEMYA